MVKFVAPAWNLSLDTGGVHCSRAMHLRLNQAVETPLVTVTTGLSYVIAPEVVSAEEMLHAIGPLARKQE